MENHRSYQCTHKSLAGKICGRVFSRAWNLKRHVAQVHESTSSHRQLTFVHVHPKPTTGSATVLVEETVAKHPEKIAMHDLMEKNVISRPQEPWPPTPDPGSATGSRLATRPAHAAAVQNRLIAQRDTQAVHNGIAFGPELTNNHGYGWSAGRPSTARLPQEAHGHIAQDEAVQDRRWLGDIMAREQAPAYDVKRSRKIPQQERAIMWLTRTAFDVFRAHLDERLASWGVRPGHASTCVLAPADWEALRPTRLMSLFHAQSCPPAMSQQPVFKYADHLTSLPRAIAWFSTQPRSGLELDVFLGCGPYKSMDASHTCHHHNCLVHIVYEPSDVNNDRKQCHEQARFLRSQRSFIPPFCRVHEPPCLLQHAALTTFEIYTIQFFVLGRSQGKPQDQPPPPRPRWHTWNTLEYRTPLSKVLIGNQPTILSVADAQLSMNPEEPPKHRPELVCKFCSKIKAFKRIGALWAHLVQAHRGEDDQRKLEEIRRTAKVWGEYLQKHSLGGERDGATMQRMAEAARDDLPWETVLSWKLC